MNLTITKSRATKASPMKGRSLKGQSFDRSHQNQQSTKCAFNIFGDCAKNNTNLEKEDEPNQEKILCNKYTHLGTSPRKDHQNSTQKQKIFLSIKSNKQSFQTSQETKKIHFLSSHKDSKSKQKNKVNFNLAQHQMQEIMRLKQQTPQNSFQLGGRSYEIKQSIKLSTNLPSATHKNHKQSTPNKYSKLTLSSTLKSQVQPNISQFQYKHLLARQTHTFPSKEEISCEKLHIPIKESNQTPIELMNNYYQFIPQSITNYQSRLMGTQDRKNSSYSGPSFKQYRSGNDSAAEFVQQAENRPIINANIQELVSYSSSQQEQPKNMNNNYQNFKEKLKQRKWIGQYAETIKTFNNESEHRSYQDESIVLQRGYHQMDIDNMFITLNRGSIKHIADEDQNLPKRPYGSLGEDIKPTNMMKANKKHTYENFPILEDSLDSENVV